MSTTVISSVFTSIKYYCHDLWEEIGDHRVSRLPGLNGGPWHVISLTLLYLYFVKVSGPAFMYYVSKFIDFLDTVYFVLRKKYSHITTLHVFHHSMMPFWTYIFFKFSSYTNNGFIPMVNAFVHTLMYSYYALAAVGVQNITWKKFITKLQLAQFVLVTIHSTYFLLDSTCQCSKLLILFQVIHGILFFHLFYSFYRKAYSKKSDTTNGIKNKDE
ncbi:elongation of very long chain fatty acids protein-like protein [Leptotrombidium deliense]|uniref:Elongation of very long chain fatty acids protein n=1 Tax=Leptotrombidium deliense TaxID=299467 RepID=A0A443SKG8_9ACAR|nr:elongation of very long chain fatty acids protein-like protein [Leptotrombidium deliense]